MSSLVMFCVGLIVGWNVLPQPAWVKNLYAQANAIVRAAIKNAARSRNEESQ